MISVFDQEFVHMFDPPHLCKGIRNNLLTKRLQYLDPVTREVKHALWSVVERLYDMNTKVGKLTEEHVRAAKIKKMRVKYAAQVFSKSVADFLRFASKIIGKNNHKYLFPL